MYTPPQKPSIDPALQTLLAVAAKLTPQQQPTVAMQVAEAAKQQQAPQGIASALTQSAQAAPSVAQNMQDQQLAQMAQRMQPEQPSEGGIAALPIPEGAYAEGGVVGYAGPDGSFVDPMGMMTGAEGPEYAASGEDPRTASERQADEIRARIEAEAKAKAKAELDKKVQELTRRTIPSAPVREGTSTASLMTLLKGSSPEAQFPRPTAAEAKGIAAGIVPLTPHTESERLYTLMKAQQEGRPDFESMKARAIEEAAGEEQGGRGIEQLIRLATAAQQGLGHAGAESLRFAKEKAALDSAKRNTLIALQEAAYAQKTGNLKELMEANAKLEAARQKENEVLAQVGGNAYTALTSQRGDELQLAGQTAAARSRMAAAAMKAGAARQTLPTYGEQKVLEELVNQHFASPATITKSPEARTMISRMPGGKKLLMDLREENITPEKFMDEPVVMRAREMYRQRLEAQSKYRGGAGVRDIDSAEAEFDADTED